MNFNGLTAERTMHDVNRMAERDLGAERAMRPAQKSLSAAMAQVQEALKPVVRDATNPHVGSRYADLTAVWGECHAHVVKAGLLVTHVPTVMGNQFVLLTRLIHTTSGEEITSVFPLTPEKNTYQGLGSAITYAKRYALCALFNVVTDDDDGESASREQRESQRRQEREQAAARRVAARDSSASAVEVGAEQTVELSEIPVSSELNDLLREMQKIKDPKKLKQMGESVLKDFAERASEVDKRVMGAAYRSHRTKIERAIPRNSKTDRMIAERRGK